MKQKHFISLLIFLISPTVLISQSIKVGIGGGYTYIDNDTYYTRNVESSFFPNQLGMRNCYTINAKLKYIPTESPIIFIGELYYLSAKNDVNYMGYYSPLQSSPAKMHLSASQNVYSFGFAVETPIIKSLVTPYFSIGLLVNYFGKTKIERTPKLEPYFGIYLDNYELVISDKLRAGLNIGLGGDYKFMEKLSFDISTKYNFMNLIGKKDISEEQKEENFNTFSITAVILYNL